MFIFVVNSSIGFCLFGDRISVRSTIKFIKIVQIFLFELFRKSYIFGNFSIAWIVPFVKIFSWKIDNIFLNISKDKNNTKSVKLSGEEDARIPIASDTAFVITLISCRAVTTSIVAAICGQSSHAASLLLFIFVSQSLLIMVNNSCTAKRFVSTSIKI